MANPQTSSFSTSSNSRSANLHGRTASASASELPSPLLRMPVWPFLTSDQQKGFQESWILEVVDPTNRRSLALNLGLLSSKNGFRRVTEVTALYSQKKEGGDGHDYSRLAIRQNWELAQFQFSGTQDSNLALVIGDCEIGPDFCRGSAISKGRSLRWDLKFQPVREARFDFIPEKLARARLVAARWATPLVDLRVHGSVEIDGEKHEWSRCPASLSHRTTSREWHSWIRSQCSVFKNDQGDTVDAVFSGLSASPLLPGGLPGPRVNSFFLIHEGQTFAFNSVWKSLRSRSRNTLNTWEFETEDGPYRFRGQAQAEHRDWVGYTTEALDGSILYQTHASLSRLTLLIYRRGKLSTALNSDGFASFETMSREKNPYVPLILS